MKRIAWYTLIILSTIALVVLVWQLRGVVLIFLLAAVTAAAFDPFVDYFSRKGLSRKVALAIPYSFLFILAAFFIFVVSNPLIQDLEILSNQFASGYEAIHTHWPSSGSAFQRSLAEMLPPAAELYSGMAGSEGSQVVQAFLGITSGIASVIGTLFVTLILSLYWSADRERIERLVFSLFPLERRSQARQVWTGIEKGIGAYIRSELTQSLLAGILLWLGYRLMGLEYAVLLAFLGALAWLIPWFGAVIAVIPPFLVGLGSGYPLAILAAVFTLVVLFVQETVIEPRIFRRESYSSVVLVLMVLILANAFGLIGLILAPLVSAALQILFKYTIQSPAAATTARLGGKETIQGSQALQDRLAETRAEVEKWEEPAAPEVINLMDRLERLIEESRSSVD